MVILTTQLVQRYNKIVESKDGKTIVMSKEASARRTPVVNSQPTSDDWDKTKYKKITEITGRGNCNEPSIKSKDKHRNPVRPPTQQRTELVS